MRLPTVKRGVLVLHAASQIQVQPVVRAHADAGLSIEILEQNVTILATESLLVPALFTTSVHGALADAVEELTCFRRCPGFRRTGAPHVCTFGELFEPVAFAGSGEGLTDRAPPAIILAPIGQV